MIKSILLKTKTVRAILDGRKIEIRRVVKPRYQDGDAGFRIVANAHTGEFCYIEYYDENERDTGRRIHPPYVPGDIVYVRETWTESAEGYSYKADYPDSDGWGWRPSIHMPREAARIWLRVKSVSVERLQEIDLSKIYVEGVNGRFGATRGAFIDLWNSAFKPTDRNRYGWAANPWVWRIAFDRREKPATA